MSIENKRVCACTLQCEGTVCHLVVQPHCPLHGNSAISSFSLIVPYTATPPSLWV